MKKYFLVLLLVGLIPTSIFAWDRSYKPNQFGKLTFSNNTSFELLAWDADIDGIIDVKGTARLDIKAEANVTEKTRFGFRITRATSEKGMFELSYMKQDNDITVNRPITFDGKNYNVGANMNLKNTWFDLAYNHNLYRNSEADQSFDAAYIDGIFGVKFSKSEVDILGNVAGVTDRGNWDKSYPIPYLGLAGATQLSGNLWARASLKYMNIKVSGTDALHHDHSFHVAYKINTSISSDTELFLDLGYRHVKYDITNDNDSAEITYKGPVFGLFARF